MRPLARWCIALVLFSAVLAADDHSVIFDEDVDFAAFGTFTVRPGSIVSSRPELNFPAVARALADSARTAMGQRGLKETAANADLVVDFKVTGVDYSIGPFGRPNAINGPRGRGGRGGQVDFTEATLVLDVSRREPEELVWRGVFHDSENDAGKLAAELPKDVAKLLADFPPKRKN